MKAALFASYRGTTLPEQFSYTLPTPRKRHEVIKTGGAIVIHEAPEVVAGDSVITWRVEAASRVEMAQFMAWAASTGTNVEDFSGYWGDSFKVRFFSMEPVRGYAGGLFDLSGEFQIVEVGSWGSAE